MNPLLDSVTQNSLGAILFIIPGYAGLFTFSFLMSQFITAYKYRLNKISYFHQLILSVIISTFAISFVTKISNINSLVSNIDSVSLMMTTFVVVVYAMAMALAFWLGVLSLMMLASAITFVFQYKNRPKEFKNKSGAFFAKIFEEVSFNVPFFYDLNSFELMESIRNKSRVMIRLKNGVVLHGMIYIPENERTSLGEFRLVDDKFTHVVHSDEIDFVSIYRK